MVKEKPILFSTEMVKAILEGRKFQTRRVIKPQPDVVLPEIKLKKPCPFICQSLWVKETFVDLYEPIEKIIYKADLTAEQQSVWKWKPSLFMRREFSRIQLGIVKVDLERVQDITHQNCVAEGVSSLNEFRELWDSINEKRGFSFASNPWIWAVHFERIKP